MKQINYSLIVKKAYSRFLKYYKNGLIRFGLFKLNKYILWFCTYPSKFLIKNKFKPIQIINVSESSESLSKGKNLEKITSSIYSKEFTQLDEKNSLNYSTANEIYSLLKQSDNLENLYSTRSSFLSRRNHLSFKKSRTDKSVSKIKTDYVKLNSLGLNNPDSSLDPKSSLEEVILIDFGATTGDLVNHKLYKDWKEKIKDFYIKPFDIDETYRSAMLRIHDFYKTAN